MAADAADELVLLGRAFELQQAGRLPEAEALYAQVLAANPDDATALVNASAVALARGDLALAIGALETITTTYPARAPAWQTLGTVRNWAWDHAGAELAFGNALQLAPANADAQFGIASAFVVPADAHLPAGPARRLDRRHGPLGRRVRRLPRMIVCGRPPC
jgi:tetratricopeptide (TPR) repeat protein